MSFFGRSAKPPGFPLYLFPLRSKRMPLQSLTQQATSNELRALGKTAHNSQLTARCKFSTFNLKSPERTTEYRQAVECKARNPCILDQTDIKVLMARQSFFCRAFSTLIYLVFLLCRDSALRASSPVWKLPFLRNF